MKYEGCKSLKYKLKLNKVNKQNYGNLIFFTIMFVPGS